MKKGAIALMGVPFAMPALSQLPEWEPIGAGGIKYYIQDVSDYSFYNQDFGAFSENTYRLPHSKSIRTGCFLKSHFLLFNYDIQGRFVFTPDILIRYQEWLSAEDAVNKKDNFTVEVEFFDHDKNVIDFHWRAYHTGMLRTSSHYDSSLQKYLIKGKMNIHPDDLDSLLPVSFESSIPEGTRFLKVNYCYAREGTSLNIRGAHVSLYPMD